MSDKSKRVVIKFGSGILTKPSGNSINTAQFRRLTSDLAGLVHTGHQVILVSSGAVGAGLVLLGLAERPKDLPTIQACAAVGQSRLMRLYETHLTRYGLHAAQLLLSHQDIDSRTRYQNARNTLERLLRFRNVVPVINENDSVAVEELRFGDNDRLSAEVAILARADLLVCRSGASTVAEITAAGKPAILVPFPRAADDHQRVNAQALERAGAAILLEETKLDMVWLVETVSSLLKDPGRLRRMGDAARKLSHPNAARDIAELAARLAGIEETKQVADPQPGP